MNADRYVVALALRHYGYSPEVVETLIDRIAHHAEQPATETDTRCESRHPVTYKGVQLTYRCNIDEWHTVEHDGGSGVVWPNEGSVCGATKTHGRGIWQCTRDAGHPSPHCTADRQTWDSSPETKISYVVEQQHGDEWREIDTPNHTVHDARDERDAAAETFPREKLRIVRVTETREVVE